MKIKSPELEQHFIAGFLKYPDKFHEISSFITPDDFVCSSANKVIFQVMKSMSEKHETIDPVLISQRIKQLNITFSENIKPFDYLNGLSLRKISEGAFIQAAKDLKKTSLARNIVDKIDETKKIIDKLDPSTPASSIISTVDRIYNSELLSISNLTEEPINIFEDMERIIEERGENPIEEVGLMGPYERVNSLYGSLLRAGDITVVVARAKAGKTSIGLDYCTKIGARYKIPILHLDNGEMSIESLQMRQCAALSGVPLFYIESGKWRQNAEFVKKVRSVWPKIKNMRFDYFNVGGFSTEEMLNLVRRYYFGKVGRGNQMVLSFDYLKFRAQDARAGDSWYIMGHMLDQFKTLIQKEIIFNNKPQISMFTSVQANRSGIVRNGQTEDNESVVALSDMIGQLCSHLFLLRKKTLDEIAEEDGKWGTHKFIPLLNRHLGKDALRATRLIEVDDGRKIENYVSLNIDNFYVTEKGDVIDWLNYINIDNVQPIS